MPFITSSFCDGNANCHGHSRLARGYLRARASGRATSPAPAARSRACSSFTRAKCACSDSTRRRGRVVTRSLSPLAALTVTEPVPKSMSLIRSVTSSPTRRPAPYSSPSISLLVPLNCCSTARVSSGERTTGSLGPRRARTVSARWLRSMSRTKRQRNSRP